MIITDDMTFEEFNFLKCFDEMIDSESLSEDEKEEVKRIKDHYSHGLITPDEAVILVEKALFW